MAAILIPFVLAMHLAHAAGAATWTRHSQQSKDAAWQSAATEEAAIVPEAMRKKFSRHSSETVAEVSSSGRVVVEQAQASLLRATHPQRSEDESLEEAEQHSGAEVASGRDGGQRIVRVATHEDGREGTHEDGREGKYLPTAIVHGDVAELYTFGALGVGPFVDKTRETGCFKGVRVWTEDDGPPWADFAERVTQPPFATEAFKHAKTSVLSLRKDKATYIDCDKLAKQKQTEPGADIATLPQVRTYIPSLNLHWITGYCERMGWLAEGKLVATGDDLPHATLNGARVQALLVEAVYKHTCSTVEAFMQEKTPSWRMVYFKMMTDFFWDLDQVALFQEKKTENCALIMEGSDNGFEIFTTNLDLRDSKYCGFDVVKGTVDELRELLEHSWSELRPMLSKCKKVTVSGHSLGGSMAEMFTGCANSGRTEDPDYKKQSWEVGQPEQLPNFQCTASSDKEKILHKDLPINEAWNYVESA